MGATEDGIRQHAYNVLSTNGISDISIADEMLDHVFGQNILIQNGTTRAVTTASVTDVNAVAWTVQTDPADEPVVP